MADNANAPAISIRNVAKSFGKGIYSIRVLDDVSLDIGRREFFTLLGPSGCGKTTLLRLIAGFETSDVHDRCLDAAGRYVNPETYQPIARLHADNYITSDRQFELKKPEALLAHETAQVTPRPERAVR